MSDLEKLVTGNLQKTEEVFSPAPPLLILEESLRAPQEEIILLCQSMPEAIKENPGSAPYLVAQISAYMQRYLLNHRKSLLMLFSLSATYAKDPSKELLDRLCAWAESIEKEFRDREEARLERIAVGSLPASIDFLKEFFGEDLSGELQSITSVTKPTAKRWVAGGGMSWKHSHKISLLARTFYTLRHKQNLSEEEALAWYGRRMGSKSPREMICEYQYVVSDELRRVLRGIGLSPN